MRAWIIIGAVIISKTINPNHDFGWISIVITIFFVFGTVMDILEWIVKISK